MDQTRIRLRERYMHTEYHVITAIEFGARDVFDVIEYCDGVMDDYNRVQACNIAHKVMGIDERLYSIPSENEALLF